MAPAVAVEPEATGGEWRGHEEDEERAHPVVAEALPHLGEEQCGESARMAEKACVDLSGCYHSSWHRSRRHGHSINWQLPIPNSQNPTCGRGIWLLGVDRTDRMCGARTAGFHIRPRTSAVRSGVACRVAAPRRCGFDCVDTSREQLSDERIASAASSRSICRCTPRRGWLRPHRSRQTRQSLCTPRGVRLVCAAECRWLRARVSRTSWDPRAKKR